jgi:hypothetical protein
MVFRKVQVDATVLLGNPEVNSPHGAVERKHPLTAALRF